MHEEGALSDKLKVGGMHGAAQISREWLHGAASANSACHAAMLGVHALGVSVRS